MPIPLTFASTVAVFIPLLISMIYYFRKDTAEYAEFKAQSDTVQRQAFYRKWIGSAALPQVETAETDWRRLKTCSACYFERRGLRIRARSV